MSKQAKPANAVAQARGSGARKGLPAVLSLCLALAALIYLSATPLLQNFEPMFYKLTSALSLSRSGYVLYLSQSTAAHLRGVGGNYDVLSSPWQSYFASRKVPVTVTSNLDELGSPGQTTLILPSAVSLTEQERESILDFYNRGGSILATWATGTWFAPQKWAGWTLLNSLGGNVLGDSGTEFSKFLMVRGETPVSVSLSAGERIPLSGAAERILVFGGDSTSAGRLVNWERLAAPGMNEKNSIVQFNEAQGKKGRVVLFGFSENSWSNTADKIYPLIDDCLKWLMRRPAIVRATWPDARDAAQLVEMDTEDGFPGALELATLAEAKKIPLTFFTLTSVAKQYPDVLRRLSEKHEIAFHGDVHDGFKGQPEATQSTRIATMRKDIDQLLGPDPSRTGFRPPREEYDATTLRVLQENGIGYAVIDPNSTEGRLPFFTKSTSSNPDKSVIALPRTQRDDLNLLAATSDPVALEKAMIEDLDVVVQSGGLGVLSIHSQNFGVGSPLSRAMPYYLSYLNTLRSQVWVTDAGSLAKWWRARERATLRLITRGDNVELNMTLGGDAPLQDFALIVMTPEQGVGPKIAALKVGMPTPVIDMIDPLRFRVRFPELKPGNYVYQVTF